MTDRRTVLLVDDEPAILFAASLILRSGNIPDIVTLEDSRKVMGLLAEREIAVIVLDLTMPDLPGVDLLETLSLEHPEIPVIVVTGVNDLRTAVRCMRMGAFDYLLKPVEDERFITAVSMALEMRALRREIISLKQSVLVPPSGSSTAFSGIITSNREMKAIFRYLEAVSDSTQPVLITGETGVGKELFARAVHDLRKCSGPFVAVNVAGLDEVAFSDTLFGHVKGAYTGADGQRPGLIAKATQGTLFLDEIGDLKESLQVKLLRLLQDQAYYPLGSDTALRSEARIVVATNQDLKERMTTDAFRKDLYYRLQFHHVHIPPLRWRKDDIPHLVDHFLEEAAQTLDKKKPECPAELIPLLNSYHFPGNVRELQAILHDAVARHGQGILSLEAIREKIRQGNLIAGRTPSPAGEEAGFPLRIEGRLPTLKEAEEYLIREAMDRSKGNQGIAAATLGLTRPALNKRLKRKAITN